MRLHKYLLAGIATAIFAMPTIVSADVVFFDFRDGTDMQDVNEALVDDLDPGGVGSTATGADVTGAEFAGLTLTLVDILSPEFSFVDNGDALLTPVPTGNILSAAAGDNVATSIAANQDGIGVNNLTVSNNSFDLLGAGAEGNDFNPGEAIVFTFNQDVSFVDIEFESVANVDIVDVLVDGVSVQLFEAGSGFDSNNTGTDLGGLENLTITAGSEITFAVDGVNVTEALNSATNPETSVRIESFSVHAKPLVAQVPEPSSLALLGLIGGVAMVRRRR